MTVDQILQRHTSQPAEPATDPDAVDDRGGYGLIRGIRDRAMAVELRRRDGTVLAIPYALVEQYLYTADGGIVLRAGGREVTVTGRHLNGSPGSTASLFSSLTRQRVAWLAEQSRADRVTADAAVVVESILW